MAILKGMCTNARNSLREREWMMYKKRNRRRLRNNDFTVIASNCSGMFMYYDLELPYLTPTVNLSVEMNDFVKMVRNLRWYMEQEMVEVEGGSICPVGMLGDIKIHFGVSQQMGRYTL